MKTKTRKNKGNLQKGIEALEKNIVICMADKGVGIVVLKKNDYAKELNRLGGDKNTYKKIKWQPWLHWYMLIS